MKKILEIENRENMKIQSQTPLHIQFVPVTVKRFQRLGVDSSDQTKLNIVLHIVHTDSQCLNLQFFILS